MSAVWCDGGGEGLQVPQAEPAAQVQAGIRAEVRESERARWRQRRQKWLFNWLREKGCLAKVQSTPVGFRSLHY